MHGTNIKKKMKIKFTLSLYLSLEFYPKVQQLGLLPKNTQRKGMLNLKKHKFNIYGSMHHKYWVFNIKVDHILIWVIYLLRFTTCYITQLSCIYSKCWKWCPFISLHLSKRFTMFLATFLSVLSFTSSMARVIFIFYCFRFRGLLSKFFKETLSTVGVRHRF